jgi:hypothetical protein
MPSGMESRATMTKKRSTSRITSDELDEMPFEKYLQQKIDRLCWLIKCPSVIANNRNFLRVAIVTKHALIDFARILKGRRSAKESLWKGGPNERNNALMMALKQELIGCGLRPPEKEQK